MTTEAAEDLERPLGDLREVAFGIAYIIAALEGAGYKVQLEVIADNDNISKRVANFIQQGNPQLICLTAVTTRFPAVCKIAELVKLQNPRAFVLVGGHHVSFNPADSMQHPAIDAVCIGEGERAVVELARELEQGITPSGIDNIWLRKPDGQLEQNPTRPFLQDLDEQPFINRELWLPWVRSTSYISLLVGRGCPFKCTYCSNHVSANLAEGKYVRMRSPANIVAELQEINQSFPNHEQVYLEVETVGANMKFSHDLCATLEEFNKTLSKPMKFGINLTFTKKIRDNLNMLEMFKRAGFIHLNVGLESGSEMVRNDILLRPKFANEDFINFAQMARKVGVNLHVPVLIGLPGESVADFQETVEVIRKSEPAHVQLNIFYPYPGTVLHEKSQPYLSTIMADPTRERRKATMDLPNFSRIQIMREYILFDFKAYKGSRPLHQRLLGVLQRTADIFPIFQPLPKLVMTLKTGLRQLLYRHD